MTANAEGATTPRETYEIGDKVIARAISRDPCTVVGFSKYRSPYSMCIKDSREGYEWWVDPDSVFLLEKAKKKGD